MAMIKPIHESKEATIKRLKEYLSKHELTSSVREAIEKKINILTNNQEVLK